MRKLVFTVLITAIVAAPLTAQTPPPSAQAPAAVPGQRGATPPAQAPTPAPPVNRAPSLGLPTSQGMPASTNIRLQLTLSDNYGGTPTKKTATMVMLNGNGGMIRTNNRETEATLNVDALASAYQNGLVSVRLTFEYTPPRPTGPSGQRLGLAPTLHESITVALVDGKPMIVTESADPATDRKVTLEVTATILKQS